MFAASAGIAGAAPPPDTSTSFYREMLKDSTGRTPLYMTTEPRLDLGPNARLTGFFVDCAMPQQTWEMLNPPAPAGSLPKTVPPSLLPVMPLPPISNPAVQEPDFALLRLSFP